MYKWRSPPLDEQHLCLILISPISTFIKLSYNMHFPSTLSTLVVALSLSIGTNAWAQAADGTWVANDYVHTFDNGRKCNVGICMQQQAHSLFSSGA